MFKFDACHAKFINLAHRPDRLSHMKEQLSRAGIKAERFEAINWKSRNWDPVQYGTMLRGTPGAIGCHESQVAIMREALELGKSAFVMEDDLVFCSDIQWRMMYIENWINNNDPDFDVFWLGGTFHVGPPHWHNGRVSNFGKDAEQTSDPRIMRTFGAFSTHAYIVNVKSIEKIMALLELGLPRSIGIDYLFITLQPQLKTYSFVPGCVKQIDNMSDIGVGMTKYSGFATLNGTIENSAYWWQDKMSDFDPKSFDWKEAKI